MNLLALLSAALCSVHAGPIRVRAPLASPAARFALPAPALARPAASRSAGTLGPIRAIRAVRAPAPDRAGASEVSFIGFRLSSARSESGLSRIWLVGGIGDRSVEVFYDGWEEGLSAGGFYLTLSPSGQRRRPMRAEELRSLDSWLEIQLSIDWPDPNARIYRALRKAIAETLRTRR